MRIPSRRVAEAAAADGLPALVPASGRARPGRRWRYPLLGLASTTVCGAAYAFSVFIAPLEAEFGWARAETVLAFSTAILCFGVSVALGGIVVDRFGPRLPFVLGALLMAGSQVLAGQVSSVAELVLAWGVMLGVAIGLVYTAATVALTVRWFPDLGARGPAMGVALAGMGAGAVLAAPLWTAGIAEAGWRATYVLTGGVYLAVLALVAVPLRFPRPGELVDGGGGAAGPVGDTLGAAVRTSHLWFLALQFFLVVFGGLMVIGQVAAIVREAPPSGSGLGPATAATLVAVLGVCNALGRPLFGGLSSLVGIRTAMVLCSLVMAGGLALLAIAATAPVAAVAVALLGLAFGGSLALSPIMTAAIFGAAFVARVYGLVYAIGFGAGGFAGSQAGGVVVGLTGSYDGALLAAGAMAVAAGIVARLTLPARGNERRARGPEPARRAGAPAQVV